MSREAYLEAHPGAVITSASTLMGFKQRGRNNFNWINQAKARGDDLSEYRKKMGAAVSASIMSNDAERARRSQTMADINRRPEARKRSSEVAKRTSARPEVIKQRSKQLAAWREREPDAFYEKCISVMHTFKTSKPEKWVLQHLQTKYPEMGFKGNQRLMNRDHFHTTVSQKRQIDIMSKSHKVIIEVDGYLHFNNVPQWDQLENVKAKDAELIHAAPLMGYMLVRISYDQWDAAGRLCDDADELLDMYLQLITPGVHLIGDMYPKTEVLDDAGDGFEVAS